MVEVQLVKRQNITNPKFTIVIPIRDRYGARLRNCLRSIKLQTVEEVEIIIADFGSDKDKHQQLKKTAEPFDCTIYYYPERPIWSFSVASNLGIRRSQAPFVATLDVDCILDRNAVEQTLQRFEQSKEILVVSRVCHCPQDLDIGSIELPRDYGNLKAQCCPPRKWGIGGFMCASRKWWFKVRGYDERFKKWGGADDDVAKRARLDKLRIERLSDVRGCNIYHQWHEKSYPRRTSGSYQQKNLEFYRRTQTVVRNNKFWGLIERPKKEKKEESVDSTQDPKPKPKPRSKPKQVKKPKPRRREPHGAKARINPKRRRNES